MSSYFRFLPQIWYPVNDGREQVQVTDISRRLVMLRRILATSVLFFQDHVRDGERADTVSMRVYNNPTLDWLIYFTNMVFDPRFEWPKGYEDFEAYLVGKYGSVENAHRTTHHHEKIVQLEKETTATTIPERTVVVDKRTYQSLPDSNRRLVTSFMYESDLNERRRNITLVKAEFVPQILREMDRGGVA